MIQAIHKRLNSDEKGFTLIELMVVVLIIAILVAIAIPTFLGARERAQDRAAQSDLRNSLLAGEVWYTDNEDYNTSAADLLAIEPELAFVDGAAAAGTFSVYVTETGDDVLTFVRESAGGNYFCISKDEAAGTTYDVNADPTAIDTNAECVGSGW